MIKIRNSIVKDLLIKTEDTVYKPQVRILKKRNRRLLKKYKQIVFVLESASTRAIKIMKALKKEGYEIVAIVRRTNTTLLYGEILEVADKTYFCVSPNKAMKLCLKYKPLCYHVFCCYRYDIAEQIIKEKIGKVVFDNYDGFGGFIYGYNNEENIKITAQEKYCLENADGLTCRSFESQYQKNIMHYKFKGKRLLFLDYCNTIKNRKLREQQMAGRLLHFFYGGGVAVENQKDYAIACNSEFAKILVKNKLQYTICAMNYDENRNLIELAEVLDGFNYCKPKPYRELHRVIAHCDYGVIPVSQEKLNRAKEKGNDGVSCEPKYRYAAVNKFFDYIEGGLPIVAKTPEIILKIFKHYGMAYESTLETLESDLPILKEMLPVYQKNIEKNIYKLTMDNNIPRLIHFYNDI